MTLKEQLLKEITLLPEEEPILKEILAIIDARKLSVKGRTTSSGRTIRSEEELKNINCPYPYEKDL